MEQTGRERLAAYRDRTKLKQWELAKLLEITDSYLSQILSGRRLPGRETALRIEQEAGIPVGSWSESVRARLDRPKRKRTNKPEAGNELTHVSRS